MAEEKEKPKVQFKCAGCLFTIFTDLDVKMHAVEEENGGFSKN